MASIAEQAKTALFGPDKPVSNVKDPHPPASQWRDDFCGCFNDLGICCQTIWCFPCTVANMMGRIVDNVPECGCCNCFCFSIAMYAKWQEGADACVGSGMRRELIERYNIQNETMCASLLISLFCSPCNFCQLQREMWGRAEPAGGVCASGVTPSDTPGPWAVYQMNRAGQAMDFQTGICGCTCVELLEGLFCYPCMFGYIGSKVDNTRGVSSCGAREGEMDVGTCCAALWFPQTMAFMTRRMLMQRYNIRGEGYIKSLICAAACTPCIAMQQRREMGRHHEWPGGCCKNPEEGRQM